MNKKIFYYMLVMFVNLISAYGTQVRIEKISLNKGISHNVVYTIHQDSEGFFWFGTMFGLVRYDGRDFLSFRTDPKDTLTLSDDDIVKISETKDGKLLVGTFGGGANIFDRKTGESIHITPENTNLSNWSGIVWDIIEDKNGNIWLATNNRGLVKVNPDYNSAEFYMNNGTSEKLPSNYIRNLILINDELWLAGFGGIATYDTDSDNFKAYTNKNISKIFIKSILQISKDTLLCGTENGLYLFSLTEKKFSEIKILNSELISININNMILTENNEIWIGTDNGVVTVNQKLQYLNSLTTEDGLFSNAIVAICEDRSGIKWIGSYQGGVSKIITKNNGISFISNSGTRKKLKEGSIKDLIVDADNNLLALSSNGVTKLDSQWNVLKSIQVSDVIRNSKAKNFFNSLQLDDANNLYLGSTNGLYILDSKLKIISKLNVENSNLSSNFITKLYLDENSLWIGTSRGITLLNIENKKTQSWNPNSENNSLIGQNILSIKKDSKGNIWTGTYRGLNIIDPITGKIEFIGPAFNDSMKISNKYVFDILEEQENNMWLATGNGINKFVSDSKKIKRISIDEGLPNGVIQSLIKKRNSLYIGTNNGISIYDLKNKKFANYNSKDGTGNNIFTAGASVIYNDKVLLGGLNGITIVDPKDISKNSTIPESKIVSISIFDKELKKDFRNEEIELEHFENTITFSLAALEFTNPQNNKFSYMLSGADEDWKVTNDSKVTYNSLLPGKYLFSIKSANNDGLWNEKIVSASFTILPPFYKTTWFYILALLTIISLLFFLHFRRVQNKIGVYLKIEEAKQHENEVVRNRAAEDFHDELGHHLTRISLLIELLRTKYLGKEGEEYITRLGTLSKELSTKMRDFVWSLDSKNSSLYDLIVRLKDFGDDLFYDTTASFSVNGISDEMKSLNLTLDWRRHLTLIFKEAMNNIVKYSNCTSVDLNIKVNDNFIELELNDDGRGFDFSNIKFGNGLKNMKSRAERLRVKLAIISNLDQGTKIKLEGLIT